uniref:DNA topoisomerase I DNA binding eukaryotic-type domain-containing protein n=1 Tax=Paramormyrops kingsleyae TaxID=1676925 RepID=A0A3B3TAT5_9TELE
MQRVMAGRRQRRSLTRHGNVSTLLTTSFFTRWEEERNIDGSKWKCLEHKGPVFAPLYKPLPDHVKFYYDGKPMKLSPNAEEVATFFAKMLDHEYTTKDIFRKNFFMDWRKEMTSEEKAKITELKKCDFREMNKYFKAQLEAKKQISKEEKQVR